mgnify:FL=1
MPNNTRYEAGKIIMYLGQSCLTFLTLICVLNTSTVSSIHISAWVRLSICIPISVCSCAHSFTPFCKRTNLQNHSFIMQLFIYLCFSSILSNSFCAAEQGQPLLINTCTWNVNPLTRAVSFPKAMDMVVFLSRKKIDERYQSNATFLFSKIYSERPEKLINLSLPASTGKERLFKF